MKKTILISLIFASSLGSLEAQIYTPSGLIQGASVNNNVGIGTTNPLAKLHVNNGDSSFGSILANANESNFSLYTKTLTTQPAYCESFRLGLKYATDEGNGFISFYRGGSTSGGFLGLSTNGTERLSINANGNVGIGTTNPSSLLTLRSTSDNAVITLNRQGQWASVASGLKLTTDDAGTDYWNFGMLPNSTNTLHLGKNGSSSMSILTNGYVGIGTTIPDEKLTVKGKIHAQEVKIDLLGALVPDYVFAYDYKLKTLKEVEAFIKVNNHLPEIPSAQEFEKNGLMVAEMNMSLLKKIEELTIYTIQQDKKINMQSTAIDALKKENELFKNLSKRLSILEKGMKTTN